MDMTASIAAKSDQQNAEDYLAGPKTVTVSEVRAGSADQPVEIHLAEFPGKPFKPSKTVRRVLVAAWGVEAQEYVGRRMTLFRDPNVRWAGEPVGGIRVSHLSHIEKPLSIALTETRGKKSKHTIQPLPDAPAAPSEPTEQQVAECTDLEALKAMWRPSSPERRKQIETRVAELTKPIESDASANQQWDEAGA